MRRGALVVAILLLLGPGQAANCPNSKRHSVIFGQRTAGERLDYVDHIVREWKFLRKTTATFEYPLQTEERSGLVITYVEVLDQFSDGDGGCVELESGGPGHNHTRLKITSRTNHGLDFLIRVFARG